MKAQERIVVCYNCGALYDLHYIGKVEIREGQIVKFECKNCGMVDAIYKDWNYKTSEELKT